MCISNYKGWEDSQSYTCQARESTRLNLESSFSQSPLDSFSKTPSKESKDCTSTTSVQPVTMSRDTEAVVTTLLGRITWPYNLEAQ